MWFKVELSSEEPSGREEFSEWRPHGLQSEVQFCALVEISLCITNSQPGDCQCPREEPC